MVTFNDAYCSTPYFIAVCKKAAAILRYCGISNTVNLMQSSKETCAKIVSDISRLTANLRLSADIIIKEQESELFPVLSNILMATQSTNDSFDKCLNIVETAKKSVNSTVDKRLGIQGNGATVNDYGSEIKRFLNEAEFRDADVMYSVLSDINTVGISNNNVASEIENLEAMYSKFVYHHYNVLMMIRDKIDKKKSEYVNVKAVYDACDIALLTAKNREIKSKEEINRYLNQDIFAIIADIKSIVISSYEGGVI